MLTMASASAALDHVARHTLGYEERAWRKTGELLFPTSNPAVQPMRRV